MRAWLYTGMWPKLCFPFLLTVTIVTIVRAVRLAWWLRWTARVAALPEIDVPAVLRHSTRAGRLAQATRGLAQAALWFTCAGTASARSTAPNACPPDLPRMGNGSAQEYH